MSEGENDMVLWGFTDWAVGMDSRELSLSKPKADLRASELEMKGPDLILIKLVLICTFLLKRNLNYYFRKHKKS